MTSKRKRRSILLRIYLSILFFLFSYFTMYAFRYDILGLMQPNKAEEYRLSDKVIANLEKKLDLMSAEQSYIDDMKQVLKEEVPNYSYTLYIVIEKEEVLNIAYKDTTTTIAGSEESGKDVTNQEKIFFAIEGGAPNKHNYLYATSYQIPIKNGILDVTLFPMFTEYLTMYRCITACLSLLLTGCFYYFLRRNIKKQKLRPWFKKIYRKIPLKAAHKLSYQLMILNIVAGIIAVSCFFIMYTNRYAFFDFVQEAGYKDRDFDKLASNITSKSATMKLNKANKEQFYQLIEPTMDTYECYLYNKKGTYYVGSRNSQSLYDNFYRNNIYDVSSVRTPIMYQYTLPYDGGYGSILFYSYPLIVFVTPYMAVIILIALSLYIIPLLKFMGRKVDYIHKIQEDVSILSSGDWQHPVLESGSDEIAVLGKHLNLMRISFVDNMEKEKEARDANKDLIAAMSHDLRTPLTALNGYLEILSLQKGDPTKHQEYLQRTLHKVEEIKDLSNKMLSYALVYGKEEETDLSILPYDAWFSVLKENIDFIKLKDFRVVCDISIASHCTLFGNIQLFKRICNNIFTNIYKYGEKNKDIQVRCKMHDEYVEMTMMNVKSKAIDLVESNHIGLKSVKKMMEMQHGKYFVIDEEDVFSIILSFQTKEVS